MQTHLISNCLCIIQLRSTSAFKICPSKHPHCSNVFAPILKVWRHEIQILTLLERVAESSPSWWPVPEFLLPEFHYMLLDNFILHFIWQSMTLVIIQRLQPLHLFFSFFFLYGLWETKRQYTVHCNATFTIERTPLHSTKHEKNMRLCVGWFLPLACLCAVSCALIASYVSCKLTT